jgi:hypothetical protein
MAVPSPRDKTAYPYSFHIFNLNLLLLFLRLFYLFFYFIYYFILLFYFIYFIKQRLLSEPVSKETQLWEIEIYRFYCHVSPSQVFSFPFSIFMFSFLRFFLVRNV